MNKSSKYLKNTMVKANDLQTRYNALGASSYQSVRNPLPMHKLVLTVLPTLPDPFDVIPVTRTIRTTALGKSFLKTIEEKEFAKNALGTGYWEQNALSVDEITSKLQAKGFIVKKGTVAMALNANKRTAKVESMRFVRPDDHPSATYSYCRYFVRS